MAGTNHPISPSAGHSFSGRLDDSSPAQFPAWRGLTAGRPAPAVPEGLGLTLMECACPWASPCIATGYSGNLEFMSPENSWLIPYQTVAVGAGAPTYPPNHTWAEPRHPGRRSGH